MEALHIYTEKNYVEVNGVGVTDNIGAKYSKGRIESEDLYKDSMHWNCRNARLILSFIIT